MSDRNGDCKQMNHKRGRPKNRRAGCLLCKPQKMNGYNDESLGATGGKKGNFRGPRNRVYSDQDLKDHGRPLG